MPDFSVRADTPELMDTEDCGFAEFDACLRDLATVNRVTLTYRPTLSWLKRVIAQRPLDRPYHIVDIGSGYGDMLRRIADWADKAGIDVELTGIDLNPWSRQSAMAATSDDLGINWMTCDLFAYRPSAPVDIVISSQFAHHLTDTQIVMFLQWMENTAQIGWLVGDLHRHFVPYHVFRYWSALAGWHRFVRNDGPISITRAFTRADWQMLLARAGLDDLPVAIDWWAPFRLSVGRIK